MYIHTYIHREREIINVWGLNSILVLTYVKYNQVKIKTDKYKAMDKVYGRCNDAAENSTKHY